MKASARSDRAAPNDIAASGDWTCSKARENPKSRFAPRMTRDEVLREPTGGRVVEGEVTRAKIEMHARFFQVTKRSHRLAALLYTVEHVFNKPK